MQAKELRNLMSVRFRYQKKASEMSKKEQSRHDRLQFLSPGRAARRRVRAGPTCRTNLRGRTRRHSELCAGRGRDPQKEPCQITISQFFLLTTKIQRLFLYTARDRRRTKKEAQGREGFRIGMVTLDVARIETSAIGSLRFYVGTEGEMPTKTCQDAVTNVRSSRAKDLARPGLHSCADRKRILNYRGRACDSVTVLGDGNFWLGDLP